jgi:hypothetical protein
VRSEGAAVSVVRVGGRLGPVGPCAVGVLAVSALLAALLRRPFGVVVRARTLVASPWTARLRAIAVVLDGPVRFREGEHGSPRNTKTRKVKRAGRQTRRLSPGGRQGS